MPNSMKRDALPPPREVIAAFVARLSRILRIKAAR